MKKINIQIFLDESCDRLCILKIKYEQVKDAKLKQRLAASIIELENRMVKALGYKTYQKIISSPEFSALHDANFLVFDGVDKAKNDKDGEFISGYELDFLNVKRSAAKRNLMGKFCGTDGEELKIKKSGEQI